jgi:hypothetical protein
MIEPERRQRDDIEDGSVIEITMLFQSSFFLTARASFLWFYELIGLKLNNLLLKRFQQLFGFSE